MGIRPLFLALAIASLAPIPAAAQYPSKTVKIVVGTSPGGSPDVFARLIAQKMSESWGPVVIENRIGANGNIAAEMVSKSADRKSTRLNSSHTVISYAVFCLKKKKKTQ